MGREITARVRWQGQEGEAKVLLEGAELILRGGVKAKIARGVIAKPCADPSGLSLEAGGAPMHIAMSETEAARWVKAIEKPQPSLAAKLGISLQRPAYVEGPTEDPALVEALTGATAAAPEGAALLIAVIDNAAALGRALTLARAHPALPIWCVYPKGKAADPGDTSIRSAFRAAGWMDNKTSAVSERLTATRYACKG